MLLNIVSYGREWHYGMPVWTWALLFFVGLVNEIVERMKWTRAGSILQGTFRFVLAFPVFGPLLAKVPVAGAVLRWLAKLDAAPPVLPADAPPAAPDAPAAPVVPPAAVALFLALSLFVSSCACFTPSNVHYNEKRCVVARQTVDCAKSSFTDLLPYIPTIALALISGTPIDWAQMGIKGGLSSAACVIAALEVDFVKVIPAGATRYGMPPHIMSAAAARAHHELEVYVRDTYGMAVDIKVPQMDGTVATVSVKP